MTNLRPMRFALRGLRLAIIRLKLLFVDIHLFFSSRAVLSHVKDSNCVISTVCFNNPVLLPIQHRLLDTYVQESFVWLVIDNSSEKSAREEIEKYCVSNEIPYLRVRFNPYSARNPSRSHALTLNVVWNRVLRRSNAQILGFLDHDIFPVRNFSPSRKLDSQPVWGRYQERGARWYIWPGLMFVRSDHVKEAGLDFMPTSWGDTGASNSDLCLNGLSTDSLSFPSEESIRFRRTVESSHQSDFFEEIDGWIHTVNGSHWSESARKEDFIISKLASY